MDLTIDCKSLTIESLTRDAVRVTLSQIDDNDLKIEEVYDALDPELVARYHGEELAKDE